MFLGRRQMQLYYETCLYVRVVYPPQVDDEKLQGACRHIQQGGDNRRGARQATDTDGLSHDLAYGLAIDRVQGHLRLLRSAQGCRR